MAGFHFGNAVRSRPASVAISEFIVNPSHKISQRSTSSALAVNQTPHGIALLEIKGGEERLKPTTQPEEIRENHIRNSAKKKGATIYVVKIVHQV